MTDTPDVVPVVDAAEQVIDDATAVAAAPDADKVATTLQDVGDLVSQPLVKNAFASAPAIVTEVRRGWKTSEFWGVIGAAFASLGPLDLSSKDKVIAAVLGIGYAIARGLAKAGKPALVA